MIGWRFKWMLYKTPSINWPSADLQDLVYVSACKWAMENSKSLSWPQRKQRVASDVTQWLNCIVVPGFGSTGPARRKTMHNQTTTMVRDDGKNACQLVDAATRFVTKTLWLRQEIKNRFTRGTTAVMAAYAFPPTTVIQCFNSKMSCLVHILVTIVQ